MPSDPDQILWYWTDTRAQSLALQSINGVEVGPYHAIRDRATLHTWRAQLKIIDGAPVADYEKEAMLTTGSRGRKAGSKVVWENGVRRVIRPGEEVESGAEEESSQRLLSSRGSQMAGAALVSTDDEEGGEEDSEEDTAPAPIRSKPMASATYSGDSHNRQTASALSGRYPMTSAHYLGKSHQETVVRSKEEAEIMDSVENNKEIGKEGSVRPRAKARIMNSVEDDAHFDKGISRPRTKEEIMTTGVEDNKEFDDDLTTDEDLAFLNDPAPIRGGTEESEGGDYAPGED